MKRTRSQANLRYVRGSRSAKKSRRAYRRQPPSLPPPPMGWQVSRGFVSQRAADAKYHDVGLASYPCNTTGSITHLTEIAQGTTVLTREGKSFQVTSIQVRGSFEPDTDAAIQTAAAYLVWDNQPNKALAAINDFLDGTYSEALTRRENVGRFTIIKKWIRNLEGHSGVGGQTGKSSALVDWYKKVSNRGLTAQCTVADTTGAIGNRINGALLLVTVGNEIAGTSDCIFRCNIRIGFKD